ncbi:MAG: ribulose-phosphate 3-epimerase [Halobacteria archaeon]|nr:ribulose-phosphate 3-epimerase [Halobacteria archaeon]
MVKIAPSLLSADFSHLADEVEKVEEADMLHLDVMDGHFVPNITFGPLVLDSLDPVTDLSFDTHLMIENPDDYISEFADAGADTLTVHEETCVHLHRTVQRIHDEGMDAGVAINPATPATVLDEVLSDLDRVLVMSVNPGFGGQEFLPGVLDKVEEIDSKSDVEIEIDGGVGVGNARDCVEAGVDVLVSGSSIFGSDSPAEAMRDIRNAAEEKQ